MNNTLSDKDRQAALDILVEQLGVQRAQLTPDARLEQDLKADSLTLVQIGMAMEDQFHLSIPDDQWEKVSTVGDLLDTLANILGNTEKHPAESPVMPSKLG